MLKWTNNLNHAKYVLVIWALFIIPPLVVESYYRSSSSAQLRFMVIVSWMIGGALQFAAAFLLPWNAEKASDE